MAAGQGREQWLTRPAGNCTGGPEDSAQYVVSGGELSLSNPGQLELLRSVISRGAALKLPVRGFSMHPFIRDHDVLVVSPLGWKRLKPGAVVAFTNPDSGRLTIHRIIAASGRGWLVQGDNCPEPDGVVTLEDIIGLVTSIQRKKRTIRFGLGLSGRIVALLNRGNGWGLVKRAVLFPRRAAVFSLGRLQNSGFYRRCGRRLASPVVVATATDRDLEAVQRMLHSQTSSQKKETDPRVTSLVARRGARLAGCVQLVCNPPDAGPWAGCWLFSLHVPALCRGQGIGEKLVQAVIARAESGGARELLLAVYRDNFKAIALYRKCGFDRFGASALEPLLQAEEARTGRGRIVMRRELNGQGSVNSER